MRLNIVATNHVAKAEVADTAGTACDDERPLPRLVLVTSPPAAAAVQPTRSEAAERQSIVNRYRAREVERTTSSVYDPSVAETTHAQLAPSRVVFPVPEDIEAEIIDVLRAAPEQGETLERAFARKEHELRCAFARMTPAQSRTLQDRIKQVRSGDTVAELFAKLIQSRRDRLVAFLADARRREALAASRR